MLSGRPDDPPARRRRLHRLEIRGSPDDAGLGHRLEVVSLKGVDPIPGRIPADERARKTWALAGARTRLAAARLRKGIRQEDLASAIGVSTASWRRIELGQSGASVSIGILLACSVALETPLTALIEDEWVENAAKIETPVMRYIPSGRVPIIIPEP